MSFSSIREMLQACQESRQPLYEVILESDLAESGLTRAESEAEMHRLWSVMRATSDGYCGADRSMSGFVGGDAAKVEQAAARVASRATLAGAEGGCQAEVGAASAMAAAALVDLKGGTAEQCAEAFAMALTNLEGLVCDPVAGLVEIPCVKRNVIGAMNAVSAADMALAGVVGHIPADEVIDAMAEVGNAMSKDLRETGIGGLAGTPTGCKIAEIVTMSADTEEKD